MKLKIISPATEFPDIKDKEDDIKSILSSDMPDYLKNEIISFAKRNALAESSKGISECCKQCLKAHLLKCATRQKNRLKKDIELISEFLPCRAGHEGYYIDNEELFRK